MPRCHLKPFSIDGKGAAVCLYNLKSDRLITNAPLRNQCARDYFYGPDGRLETAFQPLEGNYANVIRRLPSRSGQMNPVDLEFLRDFSLLQSLRTEMAARRFSIINSAIYDMFKMHDPESVSDVDLGVASILHSALSSFQQNRQTISDLKCALILNRTMTHFVTSDDPAVFTNRFYLQRLNDNNFGIKNSGAMLFMPLTPVHAFVCYDPYCYMVPDIVGSVLELKDIRDVFAVNQLQFIRAGANIYFRDWKDGDRVRKEVAEVADRRLEVWGAVNYLIEESRSGDFIKYRIATEEEIRKVDKLIFHAEGYHPDPKDWLSKIKWHPKPRTINTRSAAGHERPSKRHQT